jgi:hypothetical protein
MYIKLKMEVFKMKLSNTNNMTVSPSLKERGAKTVNRVGKWLSNHSQLVAVVLMVTLMASSIAFATAADADSMWNAVMNLIKTWVIRLGLVVVLVGGVMFGLGFKNDDAEQKTRGVNTMIAGGIVTAVAGLVSYLLI